MAWPANRGCPECRRAPPIVLPIVLSISSPPDAMTLNRFPAFIPGVGHSMTPTDSALHRLKFRLIEPARSRCPTKKPKAIVGTVETGDQFRTIVSTCLLPLQSLFKASSDFGLPRARISPSASPPRAIDINLLAVKPGLTSHRNVFVNCLTNNGSGFPIVD